MKRFSILILTFLIASSGLAQDAVLTVTAQPDLAEWDIIYLTDFDFDNGMNNPLVFGYRLAVDGLEVDSDGNYLEELRPRAVISLQMIANVPSLGLNYETLFDVSATMVLKAPLTITNRDLDLNIESRGILDENGNKIEIDEVVWGEQIDEDQANDLITTVMTSGSMPSGNYTFSLNVTADEYPPSHPGYGVDYVGFNPQKDINIVSPANIDLNFPPDMHEFIEDIYPVFEWSSTGCENYFIRVCEYDPLMHSSPEDAIQSEASYPFPDNGGFVELGTMSQLDYSAADGRQLEVGKSYVWQVRKVCNTTGADEEIYSELYSFTIVGAGQSQTPCQQQLQSLLPDEYNALFGTDGPLEGYGECIEFLLDNETLSDTDVANLLVQLMSGTLEIMSITVQ